MRHWSVGFFRGVSGLIVCGSLACSADGAGNGAAIQTIAPTDQQMTAGGTGGNGMADSVIGTGPDVILDNSLVACGGPCAFPEAPFFDDALGPIPTEELAVFTAPGAFDDPSVESFGSLCVLEPHLGNSGQPGALFPRNWLRPRFRWLGTGNETLWEVRLSNESQPDELVAYTRDTQWLLPTEVWARMKDIATPVTVSIRGVDAEGLLSGYRGTFSIAPVDAGGSLVFWGTNSAVVTPTSSKLQGFAVGDEGVVQALTATDVQTTDIIGEDGLAPRGFYPYVDQGVRTGFEPGEVECVGCHVSTPDGEAVVFTDNWPWNKVVASIVPETRGAVPDYMTDLAVAVMKQPWLGMQAMSPGHFEAGDRIVVTSYGVRTDTGDRQDPGNQQLQFDAYDRLFAAGEGPTRHRLAWFDLEGTGPLPIPSELPPFDVDTDYYGGPLATAAQDRRLGLQAALNSAYGLMNTTGEERSAVIPTWTHDGSEIAYVSTDISSSDGHPDWRANIADIHTIPYNNRAGGVMTPLQGASDPDFLEYYPEYSTDDAFLAFTRAPRPSVANRCVPQSASDGSIIACPSQDLGENPDGPYYNRNGQIYVIPRAGGTPTRLVANDPVVCSGETASGIINSWPKWSPKVESVEGRSYYFLIFSSARQFEGSFELPAAATTPPVSLKSSQLYMATMVVDDQTQEITTYPAVYLWNQNISIDAQGNATLQPTSNLTPAWDDFTIAEVPPPISIPR